MNLTREELRQLLVPAVVALALLGAGIALIWAAGRAQQAARTDLAQAQLERQRNAERLARIAEEEREVREKVEVYRRLRQLNVLGEEKRLEWADAMTRIRRDRELLDLRYRVDKQRRLTSLPAKPGNVDFYASTMKVDLALLHEEDLLRFLADLRASGNAYYAVKRCALTRTGQSASGGAIAPRLRADCDIDLVTLIDQGAKP
ncbi:MAG: hypothetical protein JO035_07200 [Betaproteobacteria bacterium]|nr:hypothetical protein [Betaproteobacteria bacterium]